MQWVTGIQKRAPHSRSSASYANYDDTVNSDEFSIRKYKDKSIRIFFRRSSAHDQGVGLHLPSKDVATAFGHALLMVSEGHSDNVTISI